MQKEHPFQGDLIPIMNDQFHIRYVSSNPDMVVRVNWHDAGVSSRSIADTVEEYNKSRRYFHELRDEYGVHVLNMDFVIGQDPRYPCQLYTVTDRVYGLPIYKESPIMQTREYFDEADRTSQAVIRYIGDKKESGEEALLDLGGDQFMYGKTAADVISKIYLVDLDPIFRSVDEMVTGEPFLNGAIHEVWELIGTFEMNLGQGSLRNARTQLLKLLQSVDPVELDFLSKRTLNYLESNGY